MGSPRRRRQKRALGTLFRTKQMNKDQRMNLKSRLRTTKRIGGATAVQPDAGEVRLREWVEIFSHSPNFAGNTRYKHEDFVDGQLGARQRVCMLNGSITTEDYTAVKNGLINDLSELDLNATLSYTWDGPPSNNPQLPPVFRFTDAAGTTIDIVIDDIDDAAGDFNNLFINAALNPGDEIFTTPAGEFAPNPLQMTAPFTPRRFLAVKGLNTGAQICQQIVDIVEAQLNIEGVVVVPNLGLDQGRMFFAQTQAGPEGNTPVRYFTLNADLNPGGLVTSWRKRRDSMTITDHTIGGPGQVGGNNLGIPFLGGTGLPLRFSGGARTSEARMFYGELHAGQNITEGVTHGLIMVSTPSSLCLNIDSDIGGHSRNVPAQAVVGILPEEMSAPLGIPGLVVGHRWMLTAKAVCGPEAGGAIDAADPALWDGDEWYTQNRPANGGLADVIGLAPGRPQISSSLGVGSSMHFPDALNGDVMDASINASTASGRLPQMVVTGERPVGITPSGCVAPDIDPLDFNNNVLPFVLSEAARCGTQNPGTGLEVSGGAGRGLMVHWFYDDPEVD